MMLDWIGRRNRRLDLCSFFDRLTPEQAGQLERDARQRRFRRGEMVYAPSEPAETVLFVAAGRVVLSDITPEGKESILAFVEEGEMFGESALLEGAEREEYAVAAKESHVLAVPQDRFLSLLSAHPDLAVHAMKLLAGRKRMSDRRLQTLLYRSKREQVARILLELVESYGERVGDRWEIRQSPSHQQLAALIGATRETVTVVLGHLQLEGLIRVQRKRLTVLDLDRLAQAARRSSDALPA